MPIKHDTFYKDPDISATRLAFIFLLFVVVSRVDDPVDEVEEEEDKDKSDEGKSVNHFVSNIVPVEPPRA